MKKNKTKNIDWKKLITKSAYSRKEKISTSGVRERVNRGAVEVVQIEGGELIHL